MNIKYNTVLLFLLLSQSSFGQTFCLSFGNSQVIGNVFQFQIFMSGSTSFGLGSSNLQFGFNQAGLSTPMLVSHTLTNLYAVPTVTVPTPGQASLNIQLFVPGLGKTITTTNTLLATVKFTITNPATTSNLVWSYNGGTTQTVVFNDPQPATQLFATANNSACLTGLSVSLPLELLDFHVSALPNSIVLDWGTSQEKGVSNFDIQRSTDGLLFQKIKSLPAQNNLINAEYTYRDASVKSGVTYFYRLKINELDGSTEFSPIRSARIESSDVGIEISPNPVGSAHMIQIRTPYESLFKFVLLDENGKVVLTKKFEQSTQIELGNIPKGIYFYRLESVDMIKNGRIMIGN
jgi:hypothetical protein